MISSSLLSLLNKRGILGPFSLSASSLLYLAELKDLSFSTTNYRNLHSEHLTVRSVLMDSNISDLVSALFGCKFFLWRSNFFHRDSGHMHPGVPLHHDKHFQSGDSEINFYEIGKHLSLIIALDEINESNGAFIYIPGSHYGCPGRITRDVRPFEMRPLADHFPDLPSHFSSQVNSINIPAGNFCIFHSALLHGSAPSAGLSGRTSMVGRLVTDDCVIPQNCAEQVDIFPYP